MKHRESSQSCLPVGLGSLVATVASTLHRVAISCRKRLYSRAGRSLSRGALLCGGGGGACCQRVGRGCKQISRCCCHLVQGQCRSLLHYSCCVSCFLACHVRWPRFQHGASAGLERDGTYVKTQLERLCYEAGQFYVLVRWDSTIFHRLVPKFLPQTGCRMPFEEEQSDSLR